MLLVSKVGIFGVLASSMMLFFGGMVLLVLSGRIGMLQRLVGMSLQPLIMIYTLYYMSTPVT